MNTFWTYQQSTGRWTSPEGVCVGEGYSGNGAGLNNPEWQAVEGHGPLPAGFYTFGLWFNDKDKGPLVCRLEPYSANTMFGRGGFMIHGDNAELNHTASDGCIVTPRVVRIQLAQSATQQVQVIP